MDKTPTTNMCRADAKPRTLVLCFDGTTNIFDDDNTNVVKLFSLLKRDNHEEQMVYYQPGVGTYVPPGMLLPITLKLAKIADQGIALYLDKHVMGGYEFLMKHYHDGDKICLFGFSRGAYTARALAGMLHKVGLLPPDNVEQIPFAYSTYIRSDQPGFKESAGFKRAFCREVEIEFMGVWDTVASVGLILPRQLPFTKSNPIVKTFRHAVSLDERRAKFKDHLWHVHSSGGKCAENSAKNQSTKVGEIPSPTTHTDSPVVRLRPLPILRESKETDEFTINDTKSSTDCDTIPDTTVGQPNKQWHPQEQTHVEMPGACSSIEEEKVKQMNVSVTSEKHITAPEVNRAQPHHRLDWIARRLWPRPAKKRDSCDETEYEAKMHTQYQIHKRKDNWETNVLEVWFAGCHSDVGGGAEKDVEKCQLSNISLRWMIRQIISSQCGIKFDEDAIKATNIPLEIFRSASQSSSPSNDKLVNTMQKLDEGDALAKIHDNLQRLGWWPLEFFPLFRTRRDQTGDSHISLRPRFNLFRARHPHTSNGTIKLHRSVKHRMDNSEASSLKCKYEYKARIADLKIEWVD